MKKKSFAGSAVNSKRTLTWVFKAFLTRLFRGWMFTSHGEGLDDVTCIVFARSSRKIVNVVNFVAEFSPGHKWETAGQVTLQYQKSHSFKNTRGKWQIVY